MRQSVMTLTTMPRIATLNLATLSLPDWHPEAANDPVCRVYGYAIGHPDGTILFDTGVGVDNEFIDEVYDPQLHSLDDELGNHGFATDSVIAIVNSHLHFDHCGQNHLLDHAPIWITQAELDVSTTEFYTVPEWAEIEPDRLRLASDGEAIADGVTILHTPGHTPGHLSITVTDNTGLEIIVGQACYTCAEYDAAILQPADMHTPDWHATGLDSLARLRALQPDRAHFSHDATTYTPS